MRGLITIIVYVLSWFCGIAALAQGNHVPAETQNSEMRQFRIYYRVNKTQIDPDYMSNPYSLQVIAKYLSESSRIDSIVIYSYASPEGPYENNKYLARERGRSARDYILSLVPSWRQLPDSVIRLRPDAENWAGLNEEVQLHYHEADRNKVLAILNSSLPDARKKTELMRLNGGRTWRHIIRTIMPSLRYSTWITVWAPVFLSAVEPRQVDLTPPDFLQRPLPLLDLPYVQSKRSRTVLAVKTNLLYDLFSWANFSVEVPFTIRGQKFSVLYQHQFPWWTWGQGNNEYCNRFLSSGGELRWWIAPKYHAARGRRVERDCLTGWHIGLYALSGKWDFERRRDICYQGEFWSTGVTAGYAMPVGRRANLEFTLAVGYAGIPYRGFTPSPDYEILYRDPDRHGRWHYFGPTRAEVSLVLPIRTTRTIKQKGGGL